MFFRDLTLYRDAFKGFDGDVWDLREEIMKRWCGGDCSACAVKDEGCWSLKPGERILFEAH